jgi:transcriptional regulator with XRE-family HTH domain
MTTARRAQHGAAGEPHKVDLGARVKALRRASGLTLKQLSARSGLSTSALSKIENDQISPTYGKIFQLARGLGVDLSDLFEAQPREVPRARKSVTRAGEGKLYETPTRVYEMLCTDVIGKRVNPFRATIKAGTPYDPGPLNAHAGEEIILVLSGRVELITESYAPIVLEPGDCAYYDSTMGHQCVAVGDEDAEVFWVCSTDELTGRLESGSDGDP